MRLVSFEYGGRATYGTIEGDLIAPVSDALARRWPTLCAALAAGGLDEIRAQAGTSGAMLKASEVRYLPVLTEPGKILCVGLNYRTHIAETGRDTPKFPMIFSRYPDSLVGCGEPLVRPKVSHQFDFEGELAFVIGKAGRHIPRERALDHVAGYACFNDGTIREYQYHTTQFTVGKTFWRSGSLGPWLATTDEVPDPSALTLETRLNGQVMQHAPTGDLLFDVPHLVSYLSEIFPLQPGDIVATGTTGGIGAKRNPPVWMKPGDVIEVEITGLGLLRNTIEDEV